MDEAIKEYRALGKQVQEMMPELRRTNQEIQVAVKNWGRLGERADNFLEKNEDRIVKTIDSLNKTIMDVSDVFNEENKRNLSGTLKNLNAGTERLDSLSKNADELLKESRATLRKFNETLTHTNEVVVNLEQVSKPLSERGPTIVKNVDESLDKLNKTMSDVRELVRAIGQGDGSLKRFISDPALYNNVNDTIFMVQRLMPRIDRILKDMEVFADKLARHPESIGLGGVVHPSKGLKEVPSSSSHYLWPGH
jgi:phospholipid/cholesterol/gamma-HCH transport system substrate-binding protein